MALIGNNGGLIGAKRTTNLSSGVGVWTANEQALLKSAGLWPLIGDPYWGYVSLLFYMDGSNGSTTFIDSSLNALTVTTNGNAQISTAQSKFGGASSYFDGTGDYLTVVPATAHYYTGDFTIELWMYQDTYKDSVLISSANSNQNNIQIFRLNSIGNGSISIYIDNNEANSGLIIGPVSGAFSTDAWVHLAFTRSGSTGRLFVNGSLVGTKTSWTQGIRADVIGCLFNSGIRNTTLDYNGYIDMVRFTKGIARYTDNFIPPSSAFVNVGSYIDPYWPSTSLLLHMNGSNGSTSFVDSSSNNVTCTPTGATISTTQSKFGGASAYFTGVSYINATSSFSLFEFGTGDFTIEAWTYLSGGGSLYYPAVFSMTHANRKMFIRYGDSGTGYKLMVALLDGNFSIIYSCAVTQTTYQNQWVHIAFTRSSGTCRLFVNGVMQNLSSGANPGSYPLTSFTDTTNVTSVTNVTVGAEAGCWNGYLDEVRVTKGIARYTASFTPPTTPFPNG